MGGNPYFYFTPYQQDTQAALDGLREQEFKAGRYDPAMSMADPPSYMFKFKFPPDDASPAPGARHGSIDEAIAAAEADGTCSILDIDRVTNEPDFGAACPLPPDELTRVFGTAEPTREHIEAALLKDHGAEFWEQIDRGHARYIVVYENAEPSEFFFAGYSVD